MKEMVVCFPLCGGKIILGKRKCPDRPWFGKLSGFGGRVEEGETPGQAQVREFFEETGVRIREQDLILVGMILLCLGGKEKMLYVYTVEHWEGTIVETDEMAPEAFSITQIPFDRMVKGDDCWLSWILTGYYFEACLVRGKDLDELEKFEFTHVSFMFWF